MRRFVLAAFLVLTSLLAGPIAGAEAAPLPALVTTHVYMATATVTRAHPTMNQTETVSARLLDHGKGMAGALMTTRWYYKTTVSSCSGITLASGWATCSRSISHATPGYAVRISISFAKAGQTLANTSTSFTPAGASGTSGSNAGGTSTGGGSSGARIGATCRDGSHSNATGRGACSHHGGVGQWLLAP